MDEKWTNELNENVNEIVIFLYEASCMFHITYLGTSLSYLSATLRDIQMGKNRSN